MNPRAPPWAISPPTMFASLMYDHGPALLDSEWIRGPCFMNGLTLGLHHMNEPIYGVSHTRSLNEFLKGIPIGNKHVRGILNSDPNTCVLTFKLIAIRKITSFFHGIQHIEQHRKTRVTSLQLLN